MGLSGWLASLLGHGRAGAGPEPFPDDDPRQRLLCELLETMVPESVPSLRAETAGLQRLSPAAVHAVEHAWKMVQGLGAPHDLSRHGWDADPVVNALFASPEQIEELVDASPELRQARKANPFVRQWYFLLTATRSERVLFGSEVRGEIIRRDVRQDSVSFGQHRLLAPSPDLETLRLGLAESALRFMAGRAAEAIAEGKRRTQELGELRTALSSQLRSVELQLKGGGVFAEREDLEHKAAEARRVLGEIAKDLAAQPHLADPDDYLELVGTVLERAESQLGMQPAHIRVNRAGIRCTADDPEGREVAFVELVSGGQRRAAVVASCRV